MITPPFKRQHAAALCPYPPFCPLFSDHAAPDAPPPPPSARPNVFAPPTFPTQPPAKPLEQTP